MPPSARTLSLLPFFLTALPLAALDLDGNGLCDVWEARYHARGADPSTDSDGDGATNAQEALAGTDPYDPASRFSSILEPQPAGDMRVRLTTQPGKSYQLLAAASPAGPWLPSGTAVLATGDTLELPAPGGGDRGFFRATAVDVDSDGDGLNDWAEAQLAGFDRQNADSFPAAAGNDLAVATEILQTLRDGGVTIAVPTATAYEKEGTPAELTFTRGTAANYPFTLFLKTAGAADPTKSSASASDYALKDGQDQAVATRRLVIPAGQTTATLKVLATADTKTEVPEQLRVLLGGSEQSAGVTLCDATNTAANQKLFVAYLRPLPNIASLGSGIATVRLQGDNDAAIVSVSFSNLASPVNSTQVLNSASAILQSVPPANYGGQNWAIRAGQSFTTDQSVLDALLAGTVKLGVFTQANLDGEIGGPFQPASGSTEFQVPADPDPIATLTGSELDRDILRFLTQATYGPTPASIADLQQRVTNAGGDRIAAYRQWIDDQFDPVKSPPPSLLAYTTAANQQEIQVYGDSSKTYYNASFDPNNSNRRRGWWMLALNARDQLRERLGFALSEVFVISDTDSLVYERSYGSAHYYDMLRTNASGDFRTLLGGVATHPMMGYYLSHLRNQKAVYGAGGVILVSPDENFAREIMQLFSIGLVQLHPDGSLKLGADGLPIPTYNQTDITEMARVFTGWSFSRRNSPSNTDTIITNATFNTGNGNERYEAQWTAPMAMFAAYHDTDAKSVIGLSLPAGQTGEKDLADVLDHLSNHANTAPFICRRLIQRLVTANPSSGYLYRVSQAFRGSGGNLPATVKAILLDPEARSPVSALSLASSGKAREPLLRTTAFLRALGAKSQLPLSDLTAYGYPQAELDKFPAGATRARISSTSGNLLQTFLSAPTVFNWFQPDFSPSGLLATNGLNSPELLLANENSVIQSTNYLYSPVYSSNGLSATSLPNQTEEPYLYPANGQNLFIDYASIEALYMAVVDTNGDSQFTKLDTGAFNTPAKLSEACAAMLDRVDLLLCSGGLKARYGSTPGKPRQLILDAVVSIRSSNNNSDSATTQASVLRDRLKTLLWLVLSSPECVIQK